MKLGYSLLLGEYIEASQIDYSDCKRFQITCAGCSEPVFKVVRDGGDARSEKPLTSVHYFSHYEKSKSFISECENRSNEVENADIRRTRSNSREQRLEYFLSVFAEAVEVLIAGIIDSFENPKKAEWFWKKTKKSKPVSEIASL